MAKAGSVTRRRMNLRGLVSFGAGASLAAAASNTVFQRDLVASFCAELEAGRETTVLQLWEEIKGKTSKFPGGR